MRMTSANCQLLTGGFESRYGHLQIYKFKHRETYCILKDLNSRNIRDFETVAAYIQSKKHRSDANIVKLLSYSKQYDYSSGFFSYTLALEFFSDDLKARIHLEVSRGREVRHY